MKGYSVQYACVTLFFLPFLVAVQDVQDSGQDNKYKLSVEVHGDQSIERVWTRSDVVEIASLSHRKRYTLYNPSAIKAGDNGMLYVFDFGDYKVKSFSYEGEHLATYGLGRGRGPGQFMMMTDVGVRNDSLVYIADPRQRRVSFFSMNGDFIRTEEYDPPPYKLVRDESGDTYLTPPTILPNAPFMKILSPGDEATISTPPSHVEDKILLDGALQAAGEKAVFVPRYLPVILTYSSEDTSGIAYPTPDYGLDLPRPRGGGRMAPANHLNGNPTISGGVLSVQKPVKEDGGIAFDLYDAETMKYMHSLRLPIDGESAVYLHGESLVAAVRDTTVSIYRTVTTDE